MKHRNLAIRGCAIILLLQFMIVLPVQVPMARGDPITDYPVQIHLTYQRDPASTITVTWQTAFATPGDSVRYDTSPKGGNPSSYACQKTGSHHTYSGASGYIHDVELTGLTSDTIYYFICGGPGNYSVERSFKTAPVVSSNFTFVFGGDSRTDPFHRSQVSEAMRHFNPSFVLHCGDMVEDGLNQGQWDSWFADLDANWTGDNGLTTPVIPSLGNHEKNSTNYYEQFALPGNEQWYYYDWGPLLRIIVLNSEAFPSQISADQVNWLESVLSSTPNYTWKIVMFHRNVYYSGGHGDATDIQQCWVPIFDKYHVDVVIQGHTHHYHRTKPMNDNGVVFSYRVGTMYLTAGRWGAPINGYVQQPYSAYGNTTHHFVLANVYQNGSLHLEGKDVNGHTFDSVWLYSPLKYWDFPNGMYLRVRDANITQSPVLTNENLTLTLTGLKGINSTTELYCANRGPPLSTAGTATWSYDNSTKTLTATVTHDNATVTTLISWVNLTEPESGPEPIGDGPTTPVVLLGGFAAFLIGCLMVSVIALRTKKQRPRIKRH